VQQLKFNIKLTSDEARKLDERNGKRGTCMGEISKHVDGLQRMMNSGRTLELTIAGARVEHLKSGSDPEAVKIIKQVHGEVRKALSKVRV
jgi:hypothetical protein